MIQRIQTVYLAIAALAKGLLFAFPFATAEKTAEGVFMDGDLDLNDHVSLMALTVLTLLLAAISIFLFKNRALQMKISIGAIVLSLGLLGTAAYFAFGGAVSATVGIGFFLPVIAIIMYFLAYKGIKSDDNLVKSSNRLR